MLETHFVTKIFNTDAESSADEIDDWLNGLTTEFEEVEVVGYATTMNEVCITVEVQYKNESGCRIPY